MEYSALHFLFIVTLFIKNNVIGEYRYKFKSASVEKITLVSPNESEELMYREDHLVQLTLKERKSLCEAAYEDSGLPTMRNEYVFEAEIYRFTFFNDGFIVDDTDVAIKCPTLPPVYLNVDDNPNKENMDDEDSMIIWIVSIRSPLTRRFSFDIEVVQTIIYIPPSEATKYKPIGSDKTWQEEAETNELYNLEPEDLWGLCTAANDHFHRRLQFLTSIGVGKPRIYAYNQDSGLAFVAICCNSYPDMYLRVKNNSYFDRVIKVIFLTPELDEMEKFDDEFLEFVDSSSDS